MTNGLLDLPPSLDTLMLISLPVTLALVTLLHLRGVIRVSSLWLPGFTALSVLALMIALNALIEVLEVNRIRYLMPLWPLTALLVGAGLWRLAIRHRILATGMLTLWLICGAGLTVATEFRYELGAFSAGTSTRYTMSLTNTSPRPISWSSTTRQPFTTRDGFTT